MPLAAFLERCLVLSLLLLTAVGAHATTVYQCRGSMGHVSFQDTPCTHVARQTREDIAGQPLIDPSTPPRIAVSPRSQHAATPRATRTARRHLKPAMSWECRAADGEVFYRHTRCPGSVPGDGVVRDNYASETAGVSRRRHTAWSPVRVHGVKVTRADACTHINAITAGSRDGHARDANVSVYAHLMGRDPCAGY